MADTTTNTTSTTTAAATTTLAAVATDDKSGVASVSIRVTTQAGEETAFKIKPTTPLKKLMDAFCSRMGASRSSVKFLYDGARIQDTQTPNDLGMADNEQVDAVLEQVGGGGENDNAMDWLVANAAFITRALVRLFDLC